MTALFNDNRQDSYCSTLMTRLLEYPRTLGCSLFSKFLGLNAVLVELDELSSGVPSFLKSDHREVAPHRHSLFSHVGVSWYMRHGLVITTRDCARGDSMRNFIRELCPGVFYTYGEPMFY